MEVRTRVIARRFHTHRSYVRRGGRGRVEESAARRVGGAEFEQVETTRVPENGDGEMAAMAAMAAMASQEESVRRCWRSRKSIQGRGMDGDTRREGHTERFLILAPRQNDHQPPGRQSETRAGNGNLAVYQLPRSIRALPSSCPVRAFAKPGAWEISESDGGARSETGRR